MSNELILEKTEELGALFKAASEKIDAVEKKYDGLDEQVKKEMLAKEADMIGKIEELKSAAAVEKQRADDMEKALNRPGAGADVSEDLYAKWSSNMAGYIRKGAEIDSDLVDETAVIYSKSIAGKEDSNIIRDFKSANHAGEGFYMLSDADKMSLKTLQVGVNPDGGYYVRPENASFTVDRTFETSPVRSVANVIAGAAESLEIIIDDNEATTGGWVGEVEDRGDTATAKIGKLVIHAHEQFAQPKTTQKFLDDAAINVEQWLADKTNDIITRTENTAFVAGDGAAKPKGFLSYDAWATATTAAGVKGVYESGKIEQVLSGTNAQVTYDGLVTLQGALKEVYQGPAVFMLQRSLWTAIRLLKDNELRSLIDPNLLATGGGFALLGKPIVFADDMQAPATDSLSIAYGDFGRGYTIYDRLGTRVLRDPYTDKPFVKFYTTKRTGGAVTNYEAIKIQKLAA
jgi:HK97 family phage major capsid protein